MKHLTRLPLLKILLIICIINCFAVFVYASVRGKVAGHITSAEDRSPLAGANVVIEGTNLGAAADQDGYYAILNVPPGTYTLNVTMIGYENVRVENVVVKMDLTADVDVQMVPEALDMQGVTVVAQYPIVDRDKSANELTMEANKIETMPIDDVTDVIGLQAGVKGMQIRGGDARQTAFIVDGFVQNDERYNNPYTAISLNTVEEVKVQTDGFNAEYENIRSGVVTLVTKEGKRNEYSGSVWASWHPPARKHFGRSIYSPNSYYLRPYMDPAVCFQGTYAGIWDQYQRRQYPEFSGWNFVSATTMKDDNPHNDLTPEGAQRLFEWQHRRNGVIDQGDYNLDLGFGGPMPVISEQLGNLRFYASHRQFSEMFIIPVSRDNFKENVSRLKLNADITDDLKLTLFGQYGEVRSASPYNWKTTPTGDLLHSPYSVASQVLPEMVFVPGYFSPADIYRSRLGVKLNHILSPQTYYEIQLQHNINRYNTFKMAVRDTTRDIDIFPGPGEYLVNEAPYKFWGYGTSSIGDEIVIGGWMNLGRDKSVVNTTNLKFDFVSQFNKRNEFKTGLNLVLNNYDIKSFTKSPSKDTWNRSQIYQVKPYRLGAYVQDKLEFEGFIANLGLRIDYTDANAAVYDLGKFDDLYKAGQGDMLEEEAPTEDAKPRWALSPRLGISHPITENSKLYFNYGHYHTAPPSTYRFRIQREYNGLVTSVGDPNLQQEKTVAYTVGYSHNLFGDVLLNLAGYYKDVTHEIGWIDYQNINSSVNYSKPDNNRYEDIRGFEITLDKHLGRWITGFVNYTYMVNTYGYFGLLKVYQDPNKQREYLKQNPYQEKPKPQPYFRANLDLHSPLDFGPALFDLYPLGGWNINFLAQWEAGSYITYNPNNKLGPGVLNNVQWEDQYSFDMRLTKTFKTDRFQVMLFLDVSNLFNFKYLYDSGFADAKDYDDYMESLHFSWEEGIEKGDDRVGEYRDYDVEYVPMQSVETIATVSNPEERVLYYDNNTAQYYQYSTADGWVSRDKEWVDDEVLAKKAYIDMPNIRSLTFLNPRYISFGIKLSF